MIDCQTKLANAMPNAVLGTAVRNWVAMVEMAARLKLTVRAMVARGLRVHVPGDACVSRGKGNWKVGLELMARAGAVPTSTEAVLFDLVKRAEGEHFRALAKLVK